MCDLGGDGSDDTLAFEGEAGDGGVQIPGVTCQTPPGLGKPSRDCARVRVPTFKVSGGGNPRGLETSAGVLNLSVR